VRPASHGRAHAVLPACATDDICAPTGGGAQMRAASAAGALGAGGYAPTSKREKRATSTFSPSTAWTSLILSATVLESSITKG
jgi:hypothetical protein